MIDWPGLPYKMYPQGPAEKLTHLCSVSPEKDLDQIIKSLDLDEFILDSFKKTSSGNSKVEGQSLSLVSVHCLGISLEIKYFL